MASACSSHRGRTAVADPAASLPVRFSEALDDFHGLDLETVRNLGPTSLVSPDQGFDGLSLKRGERSVHGIRTWRDFSRWSKRGFEPVDGMGLRMAGQFATLGAVVEVLESARPSHRSFLQELPDDEELLRVLDPRLGITVSNEFIQRVDDAWRNGQGFKDVFTESRVVERTTRRIVIRDDEGDGAGQVILTPIAWGDLNHDGIEDLVVGVWHETGGSLGYGFHAVLTRTTTGGRILRWR